MSFAEMIDDSCGVSFASEFREQVDVFAFIEKIREHFLRLRREQAGEFAFRRDASFCASVPMIFGVGLASASRASGVGNESERSVSALRARPARCIFAPIKPD